MRYIFRSMPLIWVTWARAVRCGSGDDRHQDRKPDRNGEKGGCPVAARAVRQPIAKHPSIHPLAQRSPTTNKRVPAVMEFGLVRERQ